MLFEGVSRPQIQGQLSILGLSIIVGLDTDWEKRPVLLDQRSKLSIHHSGIKRHQMLLIRRDQIGLDVRMHGRLFVWILLRFGMDIFRARAAQEVADQHAAFAVDEPINCQGVLAFELYCANFTLKTGGAQIAIVEPKRFNSAAKLRLAVFKHRLHQFVGGGF